MWAATDVCDPNDPTPSIFGYIYSHNQQTSLDANGQIHGGILSAENSNINIYQGEPPRYRCHLDIWTAFFPR